jgi:hypothetical protein
MVFISTFLHHNTNTTIKKKRENKSKNCKKLLLSKTTFSVEHLKADVSNNQPRKEKKRKRDKDIK